MTPQEMVKDILVALIYTNKESIPPKSIDALTDEAVKAIQKIDETFNAQNTKSQAKILDELRKPRRSTF